MPTATSPTDATTPAPLKPAIFHPPDGVPGGVLPIRVAGGARGGAADDFSLMVLVPDQIALTTQAQPSLYWYQSKAAKTVCEIAVTESKNPKPLLMLKSSAPTPAGIHAIRLSKFNVELKPKSIYRWSVAMIVDPNNRSEDIIASGVIQRVDPPADFAGKLAHLDGSGQTALYAQNGFWYDALQSISDQIDHAPTDPSLHQERASLLRQIGMDGTKMDTQLSKSP